MRRFAAWTLWSVVLGVAAGCGSGSGGAGGGGGGGGGGFRIAAEEARKATAQVSPSGGTVSATSSGGVSYAVTFPRGALRETRAISVTPISSVQGLALPGPVLAAVRLEPDGLALAQPVTLVVSGLPDGPAVGFHTTSDGKNLELVPLAVTGGEAQLVLHHFSPPGVAEGTLWSPDGCASTAPNRTRFEAEWLAAAPAGASQRSIALQRFALLDAYVVACSFDEGQLIDFGEAGELAFGVATQWYDGSDGIADHLRAARLDPERLLVAAMAEFHAWLGAVSWDAAGQYLQEAEEYLVSVRELDGAVLVLQGIEAAVRGASTPPCASADDAAALSWIDLEDELLSGRYVAYANAVDEAGAPDVQALLRAKTCGIQQLALRPAARQIGVDEEFAFEAVALDGSGGDVPLARGPVWSLVGDAASHLGDGLVRGVHAGTARLEADLLASRGTVLYSAEAQLTVALAGGVDVEPRLLTLRAGETAALTATVTDSTGQPLACPELHWYSSDTAVADVAPGAGDTAEVTAIAAGQANVSAVCGDALGFAQVRVYDRLTVAPATGCLAVGEQLALAARASGLPVTDAVAWSSSSGAVSVDAGVVTALAEGRAVVTATLDTLQASAVIDVTAVPICGVWDFQVEEQGTGPDVYVDHYPRVAEVTPGTTAGTLVATWGNGYFPLVADGTQLSGVFLYPWDVHWICEVWTGTAGPDGTIEASSTWDWHPSMDCGSAIQQVGFSYYWGTRR